MIGEVLLNLLMLLLASVMLVRWGKSMTSTLGRKGALYVFSCWVLLAFHTTTLAVMANTTGQNDAVVRMYDISTWCLMVMMGTLVAGNVFEWGAKKFGKNGTDGPGQTPPAA